MLRATIAIAAIIACCTSCDRRGVAWREALRMPNAPPEGWRLSVDAQGKPAVGARPTVPFISPVGACPASFAFAPAGGAEWFVAWWQPRTDSSAQLLVSRSTNGGASWSSPAVADGRDRSPLGCARPAVALGADSATGRLHLAYYVAPRQGAGVWYIQSRDHGASWHDPVGVFFGDDPARADVAAHGDTVLVAYEYPNADDARVGVAISSDAGHSFETRLPVSPNTERASDPRVAFGGGMMAVAWTSDAPAASGRHGGDFTVVDVAPVGGHR